MSDEYYFGFFKGFFIGALLVFAITVFYIKQLTPSADGAHSAEREKR